MGIISMAIASSVNAGEIIDLRDQTSPASDSPRLNETTTYVGRWNVTGGKKPCLISLLATRVESANAWAVDGACPGEVLDDVAGWRPEPDGIALARADGLTRALFADQGDRTWVWEGEGSRLTLSRAAVHPPGRG